VKVASAPGTVVVRDAEDPYDHTLLYPPDSWHSFISKAPTDSLDKLQIQLDSLNSPIFASAKNTRHARAEHCITGPAGFTESRTMMRSLADATSTHSPPGTLWRDLRHSGRSPLFIDAMRSPCLLGAE
jgi:hypothetical protein